MPVKQNINPNIFIPSIINTSVSASLTTSIEDFTIIKELGTPSFQNEDGSKAFDAALNLDIKTIASVECSYSKSFSSNGNNSNETLESIANKLAEVVRSVTGKHETGKPYVFAKWVIPIGTLPICIEDSIGIELKANFSGKVGVSCTNSFHTEVGVVYCHTSLLWLFKNS